MSMTAKASFHNLSYQGATLLALMRDFSCKLCAVCGCMVVTVVVPVKALFVT